MLSREERLWVEKEIADLYMNNSNNFDDVSEFTDSKFQREVRIMALWRLIPISKSKGQREFVLSQSLKYDCIDLRFEALSNLLDILTDPLEVITYFFRKYEDNTRFEALRMSALTKSLKCTIDSIDLKMIANYLKISRTDDEYKKMLNDRILTLLAKADLDEMLAVVNKSNVFECVNILIWPEIVKIVHDAPISRILCMIKDDKLRTSQVYGLLRIICARIEETSVLEAHKVLLIACNRCFDDIKEISFKRIEFLLPSSSLEDVAKVCMAATHGTSLSRIAITTLKEIMRTASMEDIKYVHNQSIGRKGFSELMSQIVQNNSPDIKKWSL